ncbi:hypothetical protein FHS18_001355 [Paenibacillus phyllosphaerae]|uniref:DUF2487 family protein n=1 Tax=Paenibacillus phyllosphaerae TaxID=274593 RepID=A0A7W5FLP8_9BACL|nr:DUF2487 family protein [Paenibacillus phyllosphaerae]MBB3109303.1 hypothetical protein [Paenibacillus phyllosphaerae]
MKFSELTREQWAELQPYLDTAVLPVTGLTGNEMPYEATEALERLRDVLDLVENPFKGRIVTYPVVQYVEREGGGRELERICLSLKGIGFRFVIVTAAFNLNSFSDELVSADLIIDVKQDGTLPAGAEVSEAVRKLWLGR